MILIPLGYAHSDPEDPTFHGFNVGASLLMVQTWITIPVGPNPAAWTVSTLFFFYLVYPRYQSSDCDLFLNIEPRNF